MAEYRFAAQGVSGMGGVGFGPEQGQQRVASVEAVGRIDREVREQRQTLGLGEDRAQFRTVRAPQVGSTQHTQADHRFILPALWPK